MIRLNNHLCGVAELLIALSATLVSCSIEEEKTQRREQPQVWHVSILAGKADDNLTRSLRKADEAGTALMAYWSGNETFEVYKGDVKLNGTLTAQASDDGSTVLTGTLSGATFSDEDELTIYSPSKDRDYSSQTGDESGISAKNYIKATVSIDAVDNSNGILQTSNADFSYRQSFTKFTFNQSVTSITISATGLTDSPITVTPTSATKTLYVAMENNSTTSPSYTFTTTIDGLSYTGTKSATISKGAFYTADVTLSGPTKAAVGDAYYSDGTWGSNYHALDAIKIGVVVYVGDDVDIKCGKSNGLVMALHDTDSREAWGAYGDETFLTNVTTAEMAKTYDKNGLLNTQRLNGAAGGCTHNHPAAIAARDYKYISTVASGTHPENSTEWFLPSGAQWIAAVQAWTGSSYVDPAWNSYNGISASFTNINDILDIHGGSHLDTYDYSVSSESTVDRIMEAAFSNSGFDIGNNPKNLAYCVRPFLAF